MRGRKGCRHESSRYSPTMPATRAEPNACAFARGLDRSTRGQRRSESKHCRRPPRPVASVSRSRSSREQAAASSRSSPGGLCPVGPRRRSSRSAPWGGRAGRPGSWPARFPTPSVRPTIRTASPIPTIRTARRDCRNPRDGFPAGVVLSIEPATAAPVADTEVPVIFPGYVLPDDSLEDTGT